MRKSPQGEEHVVTIIRNDDGSYREMDDRILKDLAWADAWQRGQRALQEIDEANRKVEEIREKDEKNYAIDVAKENWDRFKLDPQRPDDDLVGATNIPKEDMRKAVDDHIARRIP